MSGFPAAMLLSDASVDVTFRGAIVENYVAQALKASGVPLRYWTSPGKAEVDFVAQLGDEILGIEVKAGRHSRSKSLGVFTERYTPMSAMRLSTNNFGMAAGVRSVPLYAAYCIGRRPVRHHGEAQG
jgi:predicted AAA+ superfamily ATPase